MPHLAWAQLDTLAVPLDTVFVVATRSETPATTTGLSLTLATRSPEQRALEPGRSLTQTLVGVPGLWLNDRGHLALGERLSIRGHGSRSPFGVRGVQVIFNGVPLTLPDGQAVIEVIDPAMVARAELIRGPSSLLWGNASGGVLALTTPAPTAPFASVRYLHGGFGLHQVQAQGGWTRGRHHGLVYASHQREEGFRANSTGRISRAGTTLESWISPRLGLRLQAALAVLDTEHPGSLNEAEFQATPRASNPGFQAAQAGKESTQFQAALTGIVPIQQGVWETTVYGITRSLENPLPFAYIRLRRAVLGGRTTWGLTGPGWQASVGADAALQADDRQNWNTVAGQPGPDLRLDQREEVRALGLFVQAQYRLLPRLSVGGGARYDEVRFSLDDHFLTDGDQQGNRSLNAWSYALRLAYRLPHTTLFANTSTGFETPTTTELVNRPDGAAGLNPLLDPQRTTGVEVGARHNRWVFFFDVALFSMRVRDRLVPFEDDTGRTFFQNAGTMRQRGAEVAVQAAPRQGWHVQATYALSDFRYLEGPAEDERFPGVPIHRLDLRIRFTTGPLWFESLARLVGSQPLNDANTAQLDAYQWYEVGAGLTGWALGRARLSPLLRVENLTDAQYAGSVSINSFSGRYYEPGVGRRWIAGLQVSFQ